MKHRARRLMVTDGCEGCATVLEKCQQAGETAVFRLRIPPFNKDSVLGELRCFQSNMAAHPPPVLVTSFPFSYQFARLGFGPSLQPHAGYVDGISVVLPPF